MGRSGEIVKMDHLVAELVKTRHWEGMINRHRIFFSWEQVVGKVIAQHAGPQVIRGRVLWVQVTDSVWMQQLSLQKQEMLELINRHLGDDEIVDLRFKLGCGSRESSPVPPPTDNLNCSPIDPEKEKQFGGMVSMIQDEGLRQGMIRLWRCLEKRK